MTFDAGPSPAWLGVIAALSFGGLVIAAFASGHHLAQAEPPRAGSAPVSAPASRAADGDGDGATLRGTGSVAEPLVDRERAVLRSEPGGGEIVDELPAGRDVSISSRAGQWLKIRYQRDGKTREGWTHEVNVQRDPP